MSPMLSAMKALIQKCKLILGNKVIIQGFLVSKLQTQDENSNFNNYNITYDYIIIYFV